MRALNSVVFLLNVTLEPFVLRGFSVSPFTKPFLTPAGWQLLFSKCTEMFYYAWSGCLANRGLTPFAIFRLCRYLCPRMLALTGRLSHKFWSKSSQPQESDLFFLFPSPIRKTYRQYISSVLVVCNRLALRYLLLLISVSSRIWSEKEVQFIYRNNTKIFLFTFGKEVPLFFTPCKITKRSFSLGWTSFCCCAKWGEISWNFD